MTYPGQPSPGGAPQYGARPAHYQQPAGQYPPAQYPAGQYGVPPRPYVVPRAPNGMPLASFGDRFLAYLIDLAVFLGIGMVLAIPAVIAIFFIIGAQFSSLETDPVTGEVTGEPNFALFFGPVLAIELGVLLLSFVASYIYYVELQRNGRGVTLGKRAMKLRLIRLDDPNAPITRGVAARRWAMQVLVGGFVPFFSYVDGLWQLWDKPYQQCLHDKAAQTVVVKVNS